MCNFAWKGRPVMTYTVSGGMLNPNYSLSHVLRLQDWHAHLCTSCQP